VCGGAEVAGGLPADGGAAVLSGVSAVEIAQSEGVEAGTIRWRLHEGLRRLWVLLQPTLGKESEEDEPGNQRAIRFAS